MTLKPYCALLPISENQSLSSIPPWWVEHLTLKMYQNTTTRHSRNKKIAPILIITEAKKLISLCANELFVNQMFRDFVKLTLIRV